MRYRQDMTPVLIANKIGQGSFAPLPLVTKCAATHAPAREPLTVAIGVCQVGQVQPDRAAKLVPLQLLLAVRLIGEHGALCTLHGIAP